MGKEINRTQESEHYILTPVLGDGAGDFYRALNFIHKLYLSEQVVTCWVIFFERLKLNKEVPPETLLRFQTQASEVAERYGFDIKIFYRDRFDASSRRQDVALSKEPLPEFLELFPHFKIGAPVLTVFPFLNEFEVSPSFGSINLINPFARLMGVSPHGMILDPIYNKFVVHEGWSAKGDPHDKLRVGFAFGNNDFNPQKGSYGHPMLNFDGSAMAVYVGYVHKPENLSQVNPRGVIHSKPYKYSSEDELAKRREELDKELMNSSCDFFSLFQDKVIQELEHFKRSMGDSRLFSEAVILKGKKITSNGQMMYGFVLLAMLQHSSEKSIGFVLVNVGEAFFKNLVVFIRVLAEKEPELYGQLNLKSIVLLLENKDGVVTELNFNPRKFRLAAGARDVKIFSPHWLTARDFRKLMRESEKFKACTGSGSLDDVFSSNGLPFYQLRAFHQLSLSAFIEVCEKNELGLLASYFHNLGQFHLLSPVSYDLRMQGLLDRLFKEINPSLPLPAYQELKTQIINIVQGWSAMFTEVIGIYPGGTSWVILKELIDLLKAPGLYRELEHFYEILKSGSWNSSVTLVHIIKLLRETPSVKINAVTLPKIISEARKGADALPLNHEFKGTVKRLFDLDIGCVYDMAFKKSGWSVVVSAARVGVVINHLFKKVYVEVMPVIGDEIAKAIDNKSLTLENLSGGLCRIVISGELKESARQYLASKKTDRIAVSYFNWSDSADAGAGTCVP